MEMHHFFCVYLSLLFGTPSGIVLEGNDVETLLAHFKNKLDVECEHRGSGLSGHVLLCGQNIIKVLVEAHTHNINKAQEECAFAQKIQKLEGDAKQKNYFMQCFKDKTNERPYPYLELEYINGRDLEKFAEEENNFNDKVYSQKVEKIFKQLCEAMQLIEGQFIHRDIKPDNIMLDGNDDIKIIDFDLMIDFKADGYEPITPTGHMFATSGNMLYNSPEVKKIEHRNKSKDPPDNIKYSKTYDSFGVGGIFIYLMTYDQLAKGLLFHPIEVFSREKQKLTWKDFGEDKKGEFFSDFWKEGRLFTRKFTEEFLTSLDNHRKANKLMIPKYYLSTYVELGILNQFNSMIYFKTDMLAIACQMIDTSGDTRISAKYTLDILNQNCHTNELNLQHCNEIQFGFVNRDRFPII